jgi:hypothetical protein
VPPTAFLSQLRVVRERLLAYDRYFAPSDIALAPTAAARDVAAAEARLGVALPGWLRVFYLEVGGSLSFAFQIHDEVWQADGYPDFGGCALRIVAVQELGAPRWVEGLALFADDGSDNGWCLDLESRDGRVVWHAHDDPDREREKALDSIEELFAEDQWVEALLLPGSDLYVSELLGTGKLPPPPRKEKVAKRQRWLPEAALARDRQCFELVAELPEDGTFVMVPIGAGHCVAAGPRRVSVVNLAAGEVRSVDLKRNSWALAAHPDGRRVVAGGEHGLASLDTQSGSLQTTRAGNVTALAVDPTGTQLALGTRKGAIELWSYDNATKLADLGKHNGAVAALAFAADTVVSLGLDGVLRAHDLKGGRRWETRIEGCTQERDIGARLLLRGELVLVAGGQLDVWTYRLADGERIREPDESLPTASRLRVLVPSHDGAAFFAGRSGARVECWSTAGAWRWSYAVDDGSEVVGIAPLEDGRIVFATNAGWVGRLDPSPIADQAKRRLELLAALEAHGLAGAHSAGLTEEQLMDELHALEAMLGVKLFVPAPRGKSRQQRGAEPPELNERAIALLCQEE